MRLKKLIKVLLVATIAYSLTGCKAEYGTKYIASKSRNSDNTYTYRVKEIKKVARGPHNIDALLPFPRTFKNYYSFTTNKLGWVSGSEVKFSTNQKIVGYYDLQNAKLFFSKDRFIIKDLRVCYKVSRPCTMLGINREYVIK